MLQTQPDVPIAFLLEPKVPAGKKAKLKLVVGRSPENKWKLEIRFNGELLAERNSDSRGRQRSSADLGAGIAQPRRSHRSLDSTLRLVDPGEHHLSVQELKLATE